MSVKALLTFCDQRSEDFRSWGRFDSGIFRWTAFVGLLVRPHKPSDLCHEKIPFFHMSDVLEEVYAPPLL